MTFQFATPSMIYGFIRGIVPFSWRRSATVPLMMGTVAAGYPSPADEYLEGPLDFNELIVGSEEAATFVVRIRGNSMIGAGLHDGDFAVISRALTAVSGDIVLAILDDEFCVKRYFNRGHFVELRAENPDFDAIIVREDRRFEVWGVVKHSIRSYR